MHQDGAPSVEALLDLVGLVYAGALDPTQGPQALKALRDCLGAAASQVYTYDRRSGRVVDSQASDAIHATANAQYVSHWGALDPRPVALAALPSGGVIRCHEAFDAAYVSKSAFYQDFFIPFGFRWAIGGMVDVGEGLSTVVAGVRDPDRPAFEAWSTQLMQRLLPHVQRAASLRSALQARGLQAVGLDRMVDSLPAPGLVADDQGKVLLCNQRCTQLLAQRQVRLFGSRLCFADADAQNAWQRGLQEVAATQLPCAVPWASARMPALTMHFTPWRMLQRATDGAEQRFVLVVLEAQHAPAAPGPMDRLCAEAGLTAAEAQVLAAMVRGMPAKAIATLRDSSVHTVRSQIASILDKTGCHSQRELLARLR